MKNESSVASSSQSDILSLIKERDDTCDLFSLAIQDLCNSRQIYCRTAIKNRLVEVAGKVIVDLRKAYSEDIGKLVDTGGTDSTHPSTASKDTSATFY